MLILPPFLAVCLIPGLLPSKVQTSFPEDLVTVQSDSTGLGGDLRLTFLTSA